MHFAEKMLADAENELASKPRYGAFLQQSFVVERGSMEEAKSLLDEADVFSFPITL